MREELTLGMAVKKIAWGYILIHSAISIGTLDLLPDWLGFSFMLAAIRKLQEEEESMGLLEPLAKILIVWNAIVWAGKFLGWNLEAFPFAIIINIVGIYFHFQMLTNLASIAEKRESERGKSIRILRTVETLMNTVLTIMLYLHISEGWMIAVAIVGLIGVIWICSVLFGLARELENEVMV